MACRSVDRRRRGPVGELLSCAARRIAWPWTKDRTGIPAIRAGKWSSFRGSAPFPAAALRVGSAVRFRLYGWLIFRATRAGPAAPQKHQAETMGPMTSRRSRTSPKRPHRRSAVAVAAPEIFKRAHHPATPPTPTPPTPAPSAPPTPPRRSFTSSPVRGLTPSRARPAARGAPSCRASCGDRSRCARWARPRAGFDRPPGGHSRT